MSTPLAIQESIDLFTVVFHSVFCEKESITQALSREEIEDIAEFINTNPQDFQHYVNAGEQKLSQANVRLLKNIELVHAPCKS